VRIKVKTVGTGAVNDPWRVAVPTYSMVHIDHDKREAIVEIPDEVHGLTADDLAHEKQADHETGPYYAQLCTGCLRKVHRHFDKRYAEHAGEFRIALV
jgi:hypothetical protein